MPDIDLAELAAARCWCGKELPECEEDGGCRWTRELKRVRAEAVRSDRDRVRHALLACRTCGKIHEPLPRAYEFEAPNWASPDDGHSYSPAWVWMRGDLGSIVTAVLDPEVSGA